MIRQAEKVVDVMNVPAEGDAEKAIVFVDHDDSKQREECEILIVGGGLGGVAAALAAARRGKTVCLIEETDWLGGQITSQGVSALDEHEFIENFGGTRSYYELRDRIRSHYKEIAQETTSKQDLNPGNCWVSRLAFEPRIALQSISQMLSPFSSKGNIKIFLRTKVTAAETKNDLVAAITAHNLDNGQAIRFSFQYVIDATELGDLLPLTGTEYNVGAEAARDTSEPHAQPEAAAPDCIQSCTYTFAMEKRPEGEDNCIRRPSRYQHYRDNQPYSLRIHVNGGEIYGEETGWLDYQVLEHTQNTKGSLWEYRRLVDAGQFPRSYEFDISMFNWPGTDYRDTPLVERSTEELAKALQDAKRVSLGFAYWLQHEAPNPKGSAGFPQFLLRPDVMGTADGLCKFPYIREGRRIKALTTIREQDVAVSTRRGPRAEDFSDAAGVGWYPIDIHQNCEDEVGVSSRTRPFQIPLGGLIPQRTKNLVAGNKNIGSTHITNGCYRLHPIEWNIGECAGMLAAYAITEGKSPKDIHSNRSALKTFQKDLIAEGIPLFWLVDVPVWHPSFASIQRITLSSGYGENADKLEFLPGEAMNKVDIEKWCVQSGVTQDPAELFGGLRTRAEFSDSLLKAGKI